MRYTEQYNSESERAALLIQYADRVLVEERNVDDGNFLIFKDAAVFDLSNVELRAILKLIVDQFNVLRAAASLPEITYAQARDVIKAELGL